MKAMSRVINFRGFSRDKNIWIFGYFVETEKASFIVSDGVMYLVNPESIGQFTGLLDKNGVEIYEGDICDRLHQGLGMVVYYGCCFARKVKTPKGLREYHLSVDDSEILNVIGNIYENPELLEGYDNV